jgi:hypothetical protein
LIMLLNLATTLKKLLSFFPKFVAHRAFTGSGRHDIIFISDAISKFNKLALEFT